MNTVIRHLASLISRLLFEVRDINKRLVNLSVNLRKIDIQPPIEPIGKPDDPKQEKKQATPDFQAKLHIPDTIICEWKRDSTEKANREQFTIGVSVLTLFALIAYTWVNYHMLGQMERSNRSAEKSFIETLCQMQAQTSAQQEAAKAAGRSADEIKASNTQAVQAFKEQQSPEIALGVEPENFGTQQAGIEIVLTNSGHTAAREVSVRWFIINVGENDSDTWGVPRHMMAFGGRMPSNIPGANDWNEFFEESQEENKLMVVFDNLIDHSRAFNEQYPILPPDSVYDRIGILGTREASTIAKAAFGQKQPERWLQKVGMRHVAVGELGPDQHTAFFVQDEITHPMFEPTSAPFDQNSLSNIESGRRTLYFACRFTYRDKYHPAVKTSSDFSFRYVPSSKRFEMSVKAQQ